VATAGARYQMAWDAERTAMSEDAGHACPGHFLIGLPGLSRPRGDATYPDEIRLVVDAIVGG
jgi:hypothetical protein